jgi:hypothetical protein
MLLVVIENFLHADDTRILITLISHAGGLLVPVEDAAHEGRDKGNSRFCARNSLAKTE